MLRPQFRGPIDTHMFYCRYRDVYNNSHLEHERMETDFM